MAEFARVETSPLPESRPESSRVRGFLVAQMLFLAISPLTGGFRFASWSMLDTALLIGSLGVTALVPALEHARERRWTMRAAVALYLLAIADMCVNVVVSGRVGWRSICG